MNYEDLMSIWASSSTKPSLMVTTQKVAFDILFKAGWTVEELSELAEELSKTGKWEDDGVSLSMTPEGLIMMEIT